ncbi:hypothetical protein BGZ67_009185 [Mortierella alpina]|nr:hypothetical protein BGZ67_009185 [Mortierella alpina]
MSDSPVDEVKDVVVGGGNDLGILRAQVEQDTETLQASPGCPSSFPSLMATSIGQYPRKAL